MRQIGPGCHLGLHISIKCPDRQERDDHRFDTQDLFHIVVIRKTVGKRLADLLLNEFFRNI